VTGPAGEIVWEGYLETIQIQFGDEVRSVTLDGMATRYQVTYMSDIGAKDTTSVLALTGASYSAYPVIDLVRSFSGTTATNASNTRTTLIQDHANPPTKATSQIDSTWGTDLPVATLNFRGWYAALDWLVTANASTTLTATTTQVPTLLSAYNSTNNLFASAILFATGPTETEYIPPLTTYRTKIESLLGLGDSSQFRLAWGVYEGRQLTARRWALSSGFPTYQRSADRTSIELRAGPDVLSGSYGSGSIQPWNVRPDANYIVTDFRDPTSQGTTTGYLMNYQYIRRIQLQMDENGYALSLESDNSNDVSATIARVN